MTISFKNFWICLTFLLIKETFGQDESTVRRCVPFPQCEEVKWILAHENENPLLSGSLRQIRCGFNGVPLVWCNVDTIGDYRDSIFRKIR
jgi:hypothetical protein